MVKPPYPTTRGCRPCYHQPVLTPRRTVLWLGVYAAAMAWLEAAVVVYLRRLYYPDDQLTLFPMRLWRTSDLVVEIGREAATIVMILAVALLAVPGRTRRTAAFLYVFGVWDLFYYLWLKLALGWPVSWADWDILFLIPWAWLAPWFTPAVAALLFALWGGGVLASGGGDRYPPPGRAARDRGPDPDARELPRAGAAAARHERRGCRAVRALPLSVGGVPAGRCAAGVGALHRPPRRATVAVPPAT